MRRILTGLVLTLMLTGCDAEEPSETESPAYGLAGLPFCAVGDDRIPVPTWSPELNDQGKLTSEPPANDGQIVYIDFVDEQSEESRSLERGCIGADADKAYTFYFPYVDGGGLEVNLSGNVQFANGRCFFRGFFMNKQVMGMWQGYTATYFGSVDQFDVIKSNRFCAEK